MIDHTPKVTEWALEALPEEALSSLEPGLTAVDLKEAQAQRGFCQRAAAALRPVHQLPMHKRAAIIAAFAASRASRHRKQRTSLFHPGSRMFASALVAIGMLGLAGIGLWHTTFHRGRSQAVVIQASAQSAPMTQADLDAANYRLAAITAYLENAEAKVRETENGIEPGSIFRN